MEMLGKLATLYRLNGELDQALETLKRARRALLNAPSESTD